MYRVYVPLTCASTATLESLPSASRTRTSTMSGLPRRMLRSGKEYSAFDLALAHAWTTPVDFDFGVAIQERLVDEDLSDDFHDDNAHDPNDPPGDLHDEPSWQPLPTHAPSPSQPSSRARRDKKRQDARASSATPILKQVHHKRRAQAKDSSIGVDINAGALPHAQTAWVGTHAADQAALEFTQAPAPDEHTTGLGGVCYTQQEVDRLTGTHGLTYCGWPGHLSIPIVDRKRRVVGVLGGGPRDREGWKIVTDGAFTLLQERVPHVRLSDDRLHHRHAQESFPALARGWSHGGGQTEPGELCNNVANTRITDDLLAHKYFQRIAHFANVLFAIWAPVLFAFYTAQMALLRHWKPSLRPNFVGSIFAACTFNFGPRAICAPHLDFANLAWGWCAITALGNFDPDFGGHLILWDLGLVIHFQPGSTILIPSALYTAGGLFRWVRNGFKTSAAWYSSASSTEKAQREAEDRMWWEHGLSMLSVIDDL
ncbi:hypothetical protein B0H14DRAFT_3511215 [Mycena olivaceomarginata]|nr:hypothetical protein B0H14DRAFT_3511215 [Mycena olivaceomarginata]